MASEKKSFKERKLDPKNRRSKNVEDKRHLAYKGDRPWVSKGNTKNLTDKTPVNKSERKTIIEHIVENSPRGVKAQEKRLERGSKQMREMTDTASEKRGSHNAFTKAKTKDSKKLDYWSR